MTPSLGFTPATPSSASPETKLLLLAAGDEREDKEVAPTCTGTSIVELMVLLVEEVFSEVIVATILSLLSAVAVCLILRLPAMAADGGLSSHISAYHTSKSR